MFYQIIINIIELVAAISGTIYVVKYREERSSRYFVYFLWFTVFVELVFGWLPTFLQHFRIFENSLFSNNQWIYNINDLIGFLFYLLFFTFHVSSARIRKIGYLFISLFLISAIINLFLSNVFFETVSSFNYIFGSLLIFLFISYYFFQLLLSDNILAFYKMISFYVAAGSLLFYLSVTPILIYGKYYSNSISPEFVNIYALMLTAANIFMYTCYTIGFLICSRKNKSY